MTAEIVTLKPLSPVDDLGMPSLPQPDAMWECEHCGGPTFFVLRSGLQQCSTCLRLILRPHAG